MANLKTLFRFYKLYATLDLLWFLRDTKYCLLYIISDLVCLLCSLAGIFLLSVRFGGFGGLSQPEVLLMLGYATVVDGIYLMFFVGNNTGMISRIIGRGQLDHAVIQPAPIWIQLLAQGFCPVSCNSTLLFGIGLTWYALKNLGLTVTPVWLLFFIINAISSCMIMLAIIYLLSCLAFYAPAAAEEIAQSGVDLFSAKTYPLGGFSSNAQLIFCLFIPVGLGAWFPSRELLQFGAATVTTLPGYLPLLLTPALAVMFIAVTSIFFKKGMNHYATYGSPRYSRFGHR